MATWATDEDVLNITGRECAPGSLALAQSMCEVFAQFFADFTEADVSTRNQQFLVRAVCFQAAWLDSHPDALDAMDTTGDSADGASGTYKTDTAAFMSPLTRRCLARVSWLKGPIRIRPGRRGGIVDSGNRDDAVRDDQFTWSEMGTDGAMPRVSGANPLAERSGQVWS